MQKVILMVSLSLIFSAFAFAQSDDYKKGEFYIGYSNGRVDTGVESDSPEVDFFREHRSFNGFNVSGVYNVNRFLGIKGDLSGTYHSKRYGATFSPGVDEYSVNFKNSSSLYNALAGVQIKDNANGGRLKPFAHALVGAAHGRTKVSDFSCSPSSLCAAVVIPDEKFSDTGLAGAFGGGLDIRVNNKFQVRAFQIDYNPTRIDGTTQNNIRFGAGIVF